MPGTLRFALTAYIVMIASILPVMYLTVFSPLSMGKLHKTLLGQFIEVLIIALFVTAVGWWDKTGIRKRFSLKSLVYMLPLLILIGLILSNGVKTREPSRFAIFFLLAVFTGFCEETVFRGIIFNSLRVHGKVAAVLLSSFLFGLAHMLNLVIGVDFRVILFDVLATFGFGLVFAAAYEHTRTLLPLVIVHALIDFASYISRDYVMTEAPTNYSSESTLANLLLASILIIWGLITLFPGKRKGNEQNLHEI